MTYRDRQTIEEFCVNAEKTVEAQPVQVVKTAIKHIRDLCAYVDQLEKEATK